MAKEKKTEKIGALKKFFADFKAFALKGNVMDLAVAVIIGGAFQKIINSVVNDLIMPFIGLLTGGTDFRNWFIPLRDKSEVLVEGIPEIPATSTTDLVPAVDPITVGDLTTAAQCDEYNVATFKYGNFITEVLNFIIIAFVIFLLVKGIAKLSSLKKKEVVEEAPAAPTTKKCPYCKSEIDIEATRCPHCTSEIKE